VIFVTVGTELPFDRLVRPIDEWASRTGRKDIFAQIGPSTLRPEHIEWANFIDASECRKRIADASVVIAHAGMGTILIARELGKPILVMPRRAALAEHRTDHQLGTVRELAARNAIVPVMDENELMAKLDNLDSLAASTDHISPFAPTDFLNKIRSFIELGVISVGADEVVKSLRFNEDTGVRADRALPAMSIVKSHK
jgi:UDP-N-acetylglucosamine transferase subunit ALG13